MKIMSHFIRPEWRIIRPSKFYVYAHYLEETGDVFYIGKGTRKRGWAKSSGRSKEWSDHVKSSKVRIVVIYDNLDEIECYRKEIEVIAIARSIGLPLVNKSTGGGGPSGYESTKVKKVYSSLGEEFKSLTCAQNFLRKNGWPTAVLSNIISCCKGRSSFMYGRAWSYNFIPVHPTETDLKKITVERCLKMGKPVFTNKGEHFPSIAEASRELRSNGFPSASSGTIGRAIRTKGVSYNRMWSFSPMEIKECMSSKESFISKVSKKIRSSDGLFFNSIKEAADFLRANGYPNADRSEISRCITNPKKKSYGRSWSKVDEDGDQVS